MKKHHTLLSVAGLIVVVPILIAAMTLNVGSMNVDGLEVRDLQCELEDGGLLASMLVVGALSQHKAALDACAPEGAAFKTTWTWASGQTSGVSVDQSSKPAKNACVTKILDDQVQAPVTGTCTAVILVGEAVAAGKAADALGKLEPAEAATPTGTHSQ